MASSGPWARTRYARIELGTACPSASCGSAQCGGRICAALALTLFAAVAAGGGYPSPAEIQGYSQSPVWGGVQDAPGASGSGGAARDWPESQGSAPSSGQWSGRDWASPRDAARRPTAQGEYPADGDLGDSRPDGTDGPDAGSPTRWSNDGYGQDQDGLERYPSDRVPTDPGPARDGAGDTATGAHPGYRYRGDPEPSGTPGTAAPDGSQYRFRPLTERERARQGRGSPWRPLAPETGPRRAAPPGPWAEPRRGPWPAYGLDPNPWRPR
jgi:hypothetical protein